MTDRAICPPEHRHGASHTCYKIHRCGCDDCRTANRDATRARTRAHAYGRFDSGLVPAEPVRQHLRYLAESGMGYKRVAAIAGVSRTGVRALLFGRQDPGPRYGEQPARCGREKAAAILAVRPDLENLADGARISSRGTVRRVQALAVLGYSPNRIAGELGMFLSNLLVLLEQDQVTVAKHRTIAALYERLSAAPATAKDRFEQAGITRTRRTAQAAGWEPPLAWDDIDQDPYPIDTTADDVIDELAIDLFVEGHQVPLTRPERLIAVARLTAAGHPASHVAERLGVDPRTIVRDLADHRAATEQESA